MGFNRFYLNIIINVILIALGCLGGVYFLFQAQQIATSIICIGITIFLIGRLILYLNKTNRLLDQFLSYMQDHDPTLLLSSKYIGKTFKGYQEKLQAIADDLKKERLEKESQAKYLQALLDHVTAGIVSVDPSGKIEMTNKIALAYLGVKHLNHMKELERLIPGLGTHIQSMKPEDTFVVRFFSNGKLRYLSFKLSRIKTLGKPNTIIIFQDIKNELEEQEMESWKKLLRIITHEIMNSITPIVNLTSAMKKNVHHDRTGSAPSDFNESIASLNIIEERSRGIIHFISQYKKLTKLPPLVLEELPLSDLFNRIYYIFKEQIEASDINFSTTIQHTGPLLADTHMIEQVLINLVKNAIEATATAAQPTIELFTFQDTRNRIHIEVRDNGSGVPDKFMDQVFVPFFTTKKNGSGIGLSLSRQIMRLHKGNIILKSTPGKGTSVDLIF